MDPANLPEIDRTRCDCAPGSLACVRGCPAGALGELEGLPIFLHPQLCTYCASCEELCPRQAIRCAFEIGWDTPDSCEKTQ